MKLPEIRKLKSEAVKNRQFELAMTYHEMENKKHLIQYYFRKFKTWCRELRYKLWSPKNIEGKKIKSAILMNKPMGSLIDYTEAFNKYKNDPTT